jgi:hypothetical protein
MHYLRCSIEKHLEKPVRTFLVVSIFLTLTACAMTPIITPREYLDERTAATITIVAQPWIFNRDDMRPQLDFVHLYAIDVNRMGDHRKYLAVVKYWPAPEHEGLIDVSPVLEVHVGDPPVRLNAVEGDARELGIGQPLDTAAPRSAKTWLYPVDANALKRIAGAESLSVALLTEGARASYSVWRDGRAELSEFSTLAADW